MSSKLAQRKKQCEYSKRVQNDKNYWNRLLHVTKFAILSTIIAPAKDFPFGSIRRSCKVFFEAANYGELTAV